MDLHVIDVPALVVVEHAVDAVEVETEAGVLRQVPQHRRQVHDEVQPCRLREYLEVDGYRYPGRALRLQDHERQIEHIGSALGLEPGVELHVDVTGGREVHPWRRDQSFADPHVVVVERSVSVVGHAVLPRHRAIRRSVPERPRVAVYVPERAPPVRHPRPRILEVLIEKDCRGSRRGDQKDPAHQEKSDQFHGCLASTGSHSPLCRACLSSVLADSRPRVPPSRVAFHASDTNLPYRA